jgi:aryl-alcohol dehydrogenase-like predicted oxidoreductase
LDNFPGQHLELKGKSDFALGGTLFGWTLDAHKSFELLDFFYFELEQTIIDTADSYSQWKIGNRGGESETIIGDWIKSRGIPRESIFICSKFGEKFDLLGYDPRTIRQAIGQSLQRLQTNYLDLVYLHNSNNLDQTESTVKELVELHHQNYFLNLGLSNFSLNSIEDFSVQLLTQGNLGISAIQNHYNLVERDSKILPFDEYSKRTNFGMVSEIIPWMRKNGVWNFPYHALCRGVLTDSFMLIGKPKWDSIHQERTQKYVNQRVMWLLEQMNVLCQKYEISLASLALSWMRSEYPLTVPVVSCRSIEQLQELSDSVVLTAHEIEMLDILNSPNFEY